MIVEIVYVGTVANIDPSMLEGISVLPLCEESSGDPGLFSMKNDQRQGMHSEAISARAQASFPARAHSSTSARWMSHSLCVRLDQFGLLSRHLDSQAASNQWQLNSLGGGVASAEPMGASIDPWSRLPSSLSGNDIAPYLRLMTPRRRSFRSVGSFTFKNTAASPQS
jgi:hypothetical protein